MINTVVQHCPRLIWFFGDIWFGIVGRQLNQCYFNEMKKKQISAQLFSDYPVFLYEIRERIRSAQVRASFAVNRELILLYWNVGRLINSVQDSVGWGKGVIPRLARDIRNDFPELKGFSERNIGRMKAFFIEYRFLPQAGAKYTDHEEDTANLPQAGAELAQWALQLPWRTNILLIEKVKDPILRLAYMKAAIQNGWSRNVLSVQIANRTCERKGNALTNFNRTLPAPDSELAQEALKDPYIFDFLTIEEPYKERELEIALIAHLEKFLLELGVGFAFVGRQYALYVGDTESRVDLLFYHLRLRCFVVIELKKGPFKPEYVGKLNYYLNIVDNRLRHSSDNPTIGMILCQDRNQVIAEYALKGIDKSIGISEYTLTQALPEEFKSSLPSIEEIEQELGGSEKAEPKG